MPTDEEREGQASARKARSEAILRDAEVPVNPDLPAIETADEIELREPLEIARRAACLLIVAAKGSGVPTATVRTLVAKFDVDDALTPKERAFLKAFWSSKRTQAQFSWRSEAAWVLLWSLGFVPDLGLPVDQISPDAGVDLLERNRIAGLVARAKPRTKDQVLDEADLIYRCHWAVRDADLKGSDVPLDWGITRERHHALNWLIRHENQNWDGVSTDT